MSRVSDATQSRAVPHSKKGRLKRRHFKAKSFVQLFGARIRRNHRKRDRNSTRRGFLDHAFDDGSADALALAVGKHLEFVNVDGIRLPFQQQATYRVTVAFDDRHGVLMKAAIEMPQLPSLVPTPRL